MILITPENYKNEKKVLKCRRFTGENEIYQFKKDSVPFMFLHVNHCLNIILFK